MHKLGFLCSAVLVAAAGGQEPAARKEFPPGWSGVFPQADNYQQTFRQAEVSADQKSYRQTVNYLWLGGRLESNDVTLARGAKYTKDFTAAALRKNADPPELIKVGGFAGWHWKEKKKVVVMLDQDRILMVQALFDGSPVQFAERFPLKDCAKALDNPPRIEFSRKLESFRTFKKDMSYAAVMEVVGGADKDIGSGIHIMEYRLEDGSRVLLGFPDFQKLSYVKHVAKDGKTHDLIK